MFRRIWICSSQRLAPLNLEADQCSPRLMGVRSPFLLWLALAMSSHAPQGVVQQTNQGFAYNGESNLDLEYAMGIVGKTQPVTLYQVGDLQMGMSSLPLFSCLHASHDFLLQARPLTTSSTLSTPPTAPLTEGMIPRLTAHIPIPMDTVSA